MRRVLLVLFTVFSLFGLSACESGESVLANDPSVRLIKSEGFSSITKGDRTLIILDSPVSVFDRVGGKKVLETLWVFENTAGVEITNWKVQHEGYTIYVIWADHKPAKPQ